MRGKTGAARLALATGAPVVPVAMWGPERIFDPRTSKLRPAPADPGDGRRRAADRPEPVGGRHADAGAILEEMTDTIMLRLRDLLAEHPGRHAAAAVGAPGPSA